MEWSSGLLAFGKSGNWEVELFEHESTLLNLYSMLFRHRLMTLHVSFKILEVLNLLASFLQSDDFVDHNIFSMELTDEGELMFVSEENRLTIRFLKENDGDGKDLVEVRFDGEDRKELKKALVKALEDLKE